MTPEQHALHLTADLMCLAARTAPKGKGVDTLAIHVLTGADKDRLVREMHAVADGGYHAPTFRRDAGNVDQAELVVLIGTSARTYGFDCGFCGFPTCEACTRAGGRCTFTPGDLGIALGSALSVAADRRADNRLMFSAGYAAVRAGLLGAGVVIAYGIPLSATGKNPFFDRK